MWWETSIPYSERFDFNSDSDDDYDEDETVQLESQDEDYDDNAGHLETAEGSKGDDPTCDAAQGAPLPQDDVPLLQEDQHDGQEQDDRKTSTLSTK